MELAVIGILIALIVLVVCLLHNASNRAKKWECRFENLQMQYYAMRDTNRLNENEVGKLSKENGKLKDKISSLESKLELERKYNQKANDSYINNNKLKEEVKLLKKSKPVSRSKAVQYITQHSKFTPTQMNNQTTDNLLDYYWYLYLMNTTITEDSNSSTNSNNNTVSDEHGQITSIPNDVYADKLFNDESSKISYSTSTDDSFSSSSDHHSSSSSDSSSSSPSSWSSSDYSSGSSYDSGSSSSWSSSDSSSFDSFGSDW